MSDTQEKKDVVFVKLSKVQQKKLSIARFSASPLFARRAPFDHAGEGAPPVRRRPGLRVRLRCRGPACR